MSCKLLLFTFIAFTLVQCNQLNNHTKNIKSILSDMNVNVELEKYDFILVIPAQGCGSCILETLKFTNKIIKQSSGLFIFTNYFSKKDLKQQIGNNLFSDKKVFFDDTDLFQKKEYVYIYPILFVLKNGVVDTYTVLDPDKRNKILKNFEKNNFKRI